MGRHAYCIIAHNDPYCLQTLINLIDDERNDIFLQLDKKANLNDFIGITVKRSAIIILPYAQSINIQWGGNSLVEAELRVF